MQLTLNNFLNYLVGMDYSPHTIKSYKIDLNQLLSFLSNYNIGFNDIAKQDIREFMSLLDELENSSRTIVRKMATLKSFFKYLLREKIINKNPMILIQTPKYQNKLPQFLFQHEIELLISQFDLSQPVDVLNRAIFETLYVTGIRVAELVGITQNEIDFTKGIIKVLGKGKKERLVFFGKRVSFILKKYNLVRKQFLAENPDGNKTQFFIKENGKSLKTVDIWYIIKKLAQKLPVKRNITPHSLRHSFGTHLLDEGADIRSVQELLGHKNLSTTQIYTHVSKEKLKKVYESSHPHGK